MTGRHRRKGNESMVQSRHRRRIGLMVSSLFGSIAVLVGGTYYVLMTPLDRFKGVSAQTHIKPISTLHPTTSKAADRINVLLIGTDSRPGDSSGNTDVLILASLDNLHKRIELMSIPRDSKVAYPSGNKSKINQSLSLGGPQLTIQLVESLLHQPVDYYALTRFNGLVNMINTIGGLQINVKERMYYNTGDKQWNLIDLHPGLQTLNGVQALGFVRFRHDALGDIGRTARQQEFVTALSKRLLQPENVTKLPTLIHQLWSTMDTNMSVLELGDLATTAKKCASYQIIHETLPGSFHNPNPAIVNDPSYWDVNPEQAAYVAQQFFGNGIIQSNPVQDPSTTANWEPPTLKQGETSKASTNTTTSESWSGMAFMKVKTERALVRTGPDETYPVIKTILQGDVVKVVGQEQLWYRLQFSDGSIGYVAQSFLER